MFSPEKQTLFADLSKNFVILYIKTNASCELFSSVFGWSFRLLLYVVPVLCSSCKHSPASVLHYMLPAILRHY